MASAAAIKDNRTPRYDVPRAGSYIAALHEFFLRNRGRVVTYWTPPTQPYVIDQLQDTWGLDIRRAGKGRKHWLCTGEWFGHCYVDYTANPSTENVPRDWIEWQLNQPAPETEARVA